jgi:2'-5' RNA ligase
MTHLVAVLVPDELRTRLEQLQAQFQSPKWRITLPPHITFLYSTGRENEENLINAIATASGQTSPFPIIIKGLGIFNRGDCCIYAAVQKTPSVKQFYADLHETAQAQVNESFTPHITLSNRLSKTQAPAVYAALKRKAPSGSFVAMGCRLYRREQSENGWVHLMDFSFSSTRAKNSG